MHTIKWVTQKEAADYFRLSERSLIRLRRSGTLPPGRCWVRKIPTNLNSHVIYDVVACEYALSAATTAAALEQDHLVDRMLEN